MSMISPVSVAPMIRRTDRYFRYLMRLISPTVKLYTEMLTASAIHHGDAERLMAYHPLEQPLVIQLAGHDPLLLAKAAQASELAGFSEINLNVGCPSDRVQSGAFGVCLMKQPDVVANCLQAMREAVSIPVSIKTRIGVDDLDSEAFFFRFMETVYDSGCRHFIVHARKAWLKGLSPKENRTIPPLDYDRVYRLKGMFPDCEVVINGGIDSVASVLAHLERVDGVMLGRAIYQNPWLMREMDQAIGLPYPNTSRIEVLEQFLAYVEAQAEGGLRWQAVLPHLMGMFYQQPRGKAWRRLLSHHDQRGRLTLGGVRQALSGRLMDLA